MPVHDTEDKRWWVIEWGRRESLFVTQVCPRLNLRGQINLAKANDPYAPDLVVQRSLAELPDVHTWAKANPTPPPLPYSVHHGT